MPIYIIYDHIGDEYHFQTSVSDTDLKYSCDGELGIVRINPDHTVSQFLDSKWVEVKKQDPSSSEPEGEFD